jgi:hypothetical protein
VITTIAVWIKRRLQSERLDVEFSEQLAVAAYWAKFSRLHDFRRRKILKLSFA